MRLAVVLCILLSGCVTELLAPPAVTARTLACAVMDDHEVILVHHLAPAAPIAGRTIEEVSADWAVHMGAVADKDLDLFHVEFDVYDPEVPFEEWLGDIDQLDGNEVFIHVLWLDDLPDAATVAVLAPGVAAINTTAWEARPVGLMGTHAASAMLFHALGHTIGIVNQGVPLHDAAGPAREMPAGHEPGGVMSAAWHDASSFPMGNATYRSYSAGIIEDLRAGAAGRMCL